jgi:hypothetical protein
MKLDEASKLETYIKEKSAVKGGGLFVHLEIDRVADDMIAKPKTAGASWIGRLRKETVMNGSMVTATAYETFINNKLKKKGLEPIFKSEAPKGKEPVQGSDILLKSIKSGNYNLKVFLQGSKSKVRYTLNGEEITVEELLARGIITPSSVEHYDSVKQEQVGLDKDEQVDIITVGLDNIRDLKVGDFHFSK